MTCRTRNRSGPDQPGFGVALLVLRRDAHSAAEQRDAMFLIYNFCRQVDDIADSGLPRRAQARRPAAVAQGHRRGLCRQGAVAAGGLSRDHQALRSAARGFPRRHRRHGDGRARGHPRAGLGDARSLLRPRRQRRRPPVGQRVRFDSAKTASRSRITSVARCSSPTSCATSMRMPGSAGSICRAKR